jgi:hypothetical protein
MLWIDSVSLFGLLSSSKTFSGVVSILQVVYILSDALVRGAGFWFWLVWGTDAK